MPTQTRPARVGLEDRAFGEMRVCVRNSRETRSANCPVLCEIAAGAAEVTAVLLIGSELEPLW